MSDDAEPLTLAEVAATAAANRKFLVMLASLLVGAGVLQIDDLQDLLLQEAKSVGQNDEIGRLLAGELTELAKLFDPKQLPGRPPAKPKRRRGRD